MRKLLLFAAIAALADPANTAELPISATYGTDTTCALYEEYGSQGIVYGDEGVTQGDLDYLIVSPVEIVGHEFVCTAKTSAPLVLDCGGTEQKWTLLATISVAPDKETILYDDEWNQPVRLHKCPATAEPAIM